MTWDFEPTVIIPIAVAAALYVIGLHALWERAGRGSGISRTQAACFFAGLIVVVGALASPLDALADVLFSAHMGQHLLLILVAAPLIVLGAPAIAYAWALPRAWNLRVRRVTHASAVAAPARVLLHPASVWALFAVDFWFWHVPRVYDAAVDRPAVHALEHATMLATALLFWWTVVRLAGSRRLEWGAATVFVFTTMLQQSFVAALLTFSRDAWYPHYAATAPDWGLTPLQDQQLAGLIMWMPANLLYLIVVAILILRWLTEDEGRLAAAVGTRPIAGVVRDM